MKKIAVLLILLALIYGVFEFVVRFAPDLAQSPLWNKPPQQSSPQKTKIIAEESLVIDVVKKVGPSVVTIGMEQVLGRDSGFDPYSIFFDEPPDDTSPKERYIGSGFVIKEDGLIVTNKHVVSERGPSYIVVDQKGTKYKVNRIYRDPLNDLAILSVDSPPGGFAKVELGDSSKLEVGQYAIAIGTALGEFRNTVTTGVISGLGRGVTAGSPFEGYVERLDNVIQTDAAINPGNSGGPLLNSSGQVIGVNAAIASQGQNIGFAIPINVVKDSLANFETTGQFNRPFLGITYTMINKRAALLNELPEGAYVQEVTEGSAAQKAGIQKEDILVKIDGQKIIADNGGLADAISKKKVGDTITITVYRDNKTIELKATLQQAPEE